MTTEQQRANVRCPYCGSDDLRVKVNGWARVSMEGYLEMDFDRGTEPALQNGAEQVDCVDCGRIFHS
jgi:DNA-directed RNA polymerase subunit RPC12/RpoP